ncbi:MAG: carbohydrate kinase family protein [Deltaproteobacteria bacterium]|nr:carbohydrate kinase family protein [Deltaproteobacteria bacterium]
MSAVVVCLGAVNLDLLYRVPDPGPFLSAFPGLAAGGETSLDRTDQARLMHLLAGRGRLLGRSGGGQAANTAAALARLGIPTALIGRVGADADGVFLKAGLAGVDLARLIAAGESGRAYVLVDPTGERTILVAPNTNDELSRADLPDGLGGAKFLHLTSFVGEGPLRVQEEWVQALQGGPEISLDPGELYARRGRRALAGLLVAATTLLVTEREWALLGGPPDTHPGWAPPVVLIKRGARGVRLLTGAGAADLPPAQLPGVLRDTLGAGDVFAAGWLAGRVRGLDAQAAAVLGAKAAALSLTGAGRERYPGPEFLEAEL